jgi:hypothetical protein
MVMVINGDDAFDAAVYGEMHPGTIDFLRRESMVFDSFTGLSDKAREFQQAVNEQVQRFNSSSFMRTARAVVRKVSNIWRSDEILPMCNIGEFQQAKPLMQRYIMAEPTIREMYNEQRCDGYSETYKDAEPGKVGYAHYDYRRATNAVYFKHDKDKPMESITYYETMRGNDRELHFEELQDIHQTWRNLKPMCFGKEDPTSPYNESL